MNRRTVFPARAGLWLLLAVLLCGCGAGTGSEETVSEETGSAAAPGSYRQISQNEAKEMMKAGDGHVIVDVRTQEEYDAGHIPGAVCIPNESIGTEQPEELPDPDQVILVYCRSGRRSKEASQKLADIGYTHVFEFGGINDWTGEVVTEDGGEKKSEAGS